MDLNQEGGRQSRDSGVLFNEESTNSGVRQDSHERGRQQWQISKNWLRSRFLAEPC